MLIGVNYFGQRGQLRGCINDVKNMSTYLNQYMQYAREDMVLLTDDQQNQMSQPTKANILRAMHWLVKDARPNDSLFFHYSGHGGQTPDLDGDEVSTERNVSFDLHMICIILPRRCYLVWLRNILRFERTSGSSWTHESRDGSQCLVVTTESAILAS